MLRVFFDIHIVLSMVTAAESVFLRGNGPVEQDLLEAVVVCHRGLHRQEETLSDCLWMGFASPCDILSPRGKQGASKCDFKRQVFEIPRFSVPLCFQLLPSLAALHSTLFSAI